LGCVYEGIDVIEGIEGIEGTVYSVYSLYFFFLLLESAHPIAAPAAMIEIATGPVSPTGGLPVTYGRRKV